MIKTQRGGEILQVVTFHVGQEEFGVSILNLREINRMVEITPVPHGPVFIEGAINLRGQVIPVVDLGKRFGLGAVDCDRNTRIVVVELGEIVVGLLVDSVNEVLGVACSAIEPPPCIVGGFDRAHIEGVVKLGDRLLVLLNLHGLLSSGEVQELAAF